MELRKTVLLILVGVVAMVSATTYAIWRGNGVPQVAVLSLLAFGVAAYGLPTATPAPARVLYYLGGLAVLFVLGILMGPGGGLLALAMMAGALPLTLSRIAHWRSSNGSAYPTSEG
jgi:hypothetical protein